MGTASVTVNSATLDGTGFADSGASFRPLNPGESLALQLNSIHSHRFGKRDNDHRQQFIAADIIATVGLSGIGTNSIEPRSCL